MRWALVPASDWSSAPILSSHWSIAEPYLLVMEYVMYGKLLTHLREHRIKQSSFFNFSGNKDGVEVGEALTSKDLTKFAYGVAKGMEYLVSKGVSFVRFSNEKLQMSPLMKQQNARLCYFVNAHTFQRKDEQKCITNSFKFVSTIWTFKY